MRFSIVFTLKGNGVSLKRFAERGKEHGHNNMEIGYEFHRSVLPKSRVFLKNHF